MITTENVWSDEYDDEYVAPKKWGGNRAKLTHENANPAVPIKMAGRSSYRVEEGWIFLGWCTAPYPSKTGCPTCLVFEATEDSRLLWAHCIAEISILANAESIHPDKTPQEHE